MGQRQDREQQNKPSFKDDYDFFENFPKCIGRNRPSQQQNDCYAHAASYVYSLRNCMVQYRQLNEKLDDPLIRSFRDGRHSIYPDGTPCGDGERGGSSACVCSYFERQDGNPSKIVTQGQLDSELKSPGPVVASIEIREDFLQHLEQKKEEPYKPDKRALILARHSTTVIGVGSTSDGQKYVKCVDSNVDSEGNFYTYRIPTDYPDYYYANEIHHPAPFKPHPDKTFLFGERPIRSIWEQYWNGTVVDDWKKLGMEKQYDDWKKRVRAEADK